VLCATDLPDKVKSAGFTPLPSRSLLLVHGHDAAAFLQGLTTANVPATAPTVGWPTGQEPIPPAIYSAFLNAQGRLLQDVFIYPVSHNNPVLSVTPDLHGAMDGNTAYIIETDHSQLETLLKWLRRYKLRSKVKFQALNRQQLGVYFAWDDGAQLPLHSDVQALVEAHVHLASDKRSPSFGTRILVSPSCSALSSIGMDSPADYTLRRYLHSLPEGPQELFPMNALIHDSSLDKANAVDFRKGCYVGQELVIRTQHTGVVRKRVVPVVVYRSEEEPPQTLIDAYRPLQAALEPGSEIWPRGEPTNSTITGGDAKARKPRSVGRIIGVIGNVGLASVRLEPMLGVGPAGEKIKDRTHDEFEVVALSQASRPWHIKAFWPSWW
jgi:folate-binding protein YgfZ